MLSIGKLDTGRGDYYMAVVAKGVEDYYLGHGEAPGRWHGRGLAGLDIDPTKDVTEELLKPLLDGLEPGTGNELGRYRAANRVSGFDLTFSAPKSVSVLFGVGDGATAEAAMAAHEAAVDAALGYVERHAIRVRRGPGGIVQKQTKGMVAAQFRHRSSRAGDPSLHTHVVIANVAQAIDEEAGSEDVGPGKRKDAQGWSALDGSLLYAHGRTAGFLYQAQLRKNLTEGLGVEWGAVHNGCAEVVGIPSALTRAFSKRRQEIEARMRARGEATPRAAQVATLDTRHAKEYGVDGATLRQRWQEEAGVLGFAPRRLGEATGRARFQPLSPRGQEGLVRKLASADGLTQQASTFGRRDVVRGIAEASAGADVAEVEALADGLLGRPDVVVEVAPSVVTVAENSTDRDLEMRTVSDALRTGDGRVVMIRTGESRFSTPEMLATEARVIAAAVERRGEGNGVAGRDALAAAVAASPSLSVEQRAMVEHVTRSADGVVIVQGHAGTGKTYALDAARRAWEASGFRVVGAALAAKAARELEAGAGIQAYTLSSLLLEVANPEHGGFTRDTVVVVDEAGMVGTRQLDVLLSTAGKSGCKVVLSGDDRQLPEIDAGGAFRGLRDRLGASELVENRRQEADWEREALALLREGRPQEAVERYDAEKRLHVYEDAGVAREQLLADWLQRWEGRRADADVVIVAARKADVEELNGRARALRRESGELTGSALTVAGREFAAGDRVVTTKNSRGLGIQNGGRGWIEAVNLERGESTIRLDNGQTVTLPRSYLEAGHLSHAYAITGHKAQGMTADQALVLGDPAIYREWGYTALSRAREGSDFYVTGSPGVPELEEAAHPGVVVRPRPSLAAVVAGLGESRSQEMATDVQAGSRAQQPSVAASADALDAAMADYLRRTQAEPRPSRPHRGSPPRDHDRDMQRDLDERNAERE